MFEKYLTDRINFTCPIKTIYLSKNDELQNYCPSMIDNEISILYLGSVNNLIDIDLIIKILNAINNIKPVVLKIVGTGEKLEELEQKCLSNKLRYITYGAVYDENRKNEILSNCNYALNIMKKTVFVGVTMKSLEYFHYGIPIINNIVGDTYKIVQREHCGFNITDECEVADKICGLTIEEYEKISYNARKVYNMHFSPVVFYEQITSFINEIQERKNEDV